MENLEGLSLVIEVFVREKIWITVDIRQYGSFLRLSLIEARARAGSTSSLNRRRNSAQSDFPILGVYIYCITQERSLVKMIIIILSIVRKIIITDVNFIFLLHSPQSSYSITLFVLVQSVIIWFNRSECQSDKL